MTRPGLATKIPAQVKHHIFKMAITIIKLRSVDCSWKWLEWSDCSETCGNGTKTRMLVVLQEALHNGASCPIERTETEECDTNVSCPGLQLHDLLISFSVDCVVDDWGEWGLCSQSCGGGLMGRRKEVLVEPEYGGAECPTNITNIKYCGDENCPKGRR